MLDKLEQGRRWMNRGGMVLAGAMILCLMALAVTNVACRVFQVSFRGAYELVGFVGALVVALALGESQRRGDHILVDVLSRRFPAGLVRALDFCRHLAGAVLFALAAWRIWMWGLTISASGEVSETLKIAYHPFVFAVAVGVAALALNLLLDALLCLRGPKETSC